MVGIPYEMTLEVRWTDIDAYRHMANTSYSNFATHQRHIYLSDQGYPISRIEEIGVAPVVFSEHLQYLREVRLGQQVRFEMWMAGLATDASRWRFRHDAWLLPDGKEEDGDERGDLGARKRIHAAVITLEGSWFDLKERRIAPPPAELGGVMEGMPRHEDFEVLRPIRRKG